jgi:type II secretory pathway predicted ATPase ExeA
MNRSPFLFRDFVRAKKYLIEALVEGDETYAMLTGETGTGKTALLRDLRSQIDRGRTRVFYFSSAKKLGASGLIKVTGEALRVRTSMCHSVSLDRLLRAIAEESHGIFLWIDEAQDLPEETLAELRALAESDLEGTQRIQVLLVGLPRLRVDLQAHPHLWRRIVVREELTGLVIDELQAFLAHHFDRAQSIRLCQDGLRALFERAGGAPGLLLPMYRAVLRQADSDTGQIDVELVEEALERWELA